MVGGTINEDSDYCIDNKRVPTVKIQIEGRQTAFGFESRNNSNFPLANFKKEKAIESAGRVTPIANDKIEPILD